MSAPLGTLFGTLFVDVEVGAYVPVRLRLVLLGDVAAEDCVRVERDDVDEIPVPILLRVPLRRQMPRGVLRDPDRALHEPTVRRRVQDRDDGRGQDDEGGDGWIGRGVGEDGELGFDDGVEGGHVGDVGA